MAGYNNCFFQILTFTQTRNIAFFLILTFLKLKLNCLIRNFDIFAKFQKTNFSKLFTFSYKNSEKTVLIKILSYL